jgi:hypothetical protein
MELRESTSEFAGIVLSIVLIIGISLIPTLQIGVQGQVQRQQSPPPPTPGTTAAPSTTPAPPTPGTSRPLSPPSTTPPPPPSTTPAPPTLATTRPPLDFEVIGGAVNQSATIVIPQSSVMTMIDNLQTAMDAVADDEDAMMALESVVQQLRSGVVTRTATVLIPQSSMMTMLDNLQTAMNAVADDEDAMMALESVDQELKSAATAAGMSVENTTDGGDIR